MLLYDILQLHCTHNLLYCLAVLLLNHRNIPIFVQGAESELPYRFHMLRFFSLSLVLAAKLFLESTFTILLLLSSTFPAISP